MSGLFRQKRAGNLPPALMSSKALAACYWVFGPKFFLVIEAPLVEEALLAKEAPTEKSSGKNDESKRAMIGLKRR